MTTGQRMLYARHIAGLQKSLPLARKAAVPADDVAVVVEKALTARRPRARYWVGGAAGVQMAVATNLPSEVADVVLRKALRQP